MICLDNLNVYLDPRVRRVIEEKGMQPKFLPLHSPDYSLIELTLVMLKAWIGRHLRALRPSFEGDFEGFLRCVIGYSGCDEKAMEHLRYNAEGLSFSR